MAKVLSELEFKDDFMFSATMLDPENCRLVLECILGFSIERVEVMREKSIVYHPEYKGVRLDVYAKDDDNTRYDVEMQIGMSEYLMRSRYYHSSMDMELIDAGVNYKDLPNCYVIFICDNDPFGLKKYRYTRRCVFKEAPYNDYDDGTYTIYLSTQGENDDEVPAELVNFLKYVGNAEHTTDDPLVLRLKNSVSQIKRNREMEGRYMLFEELQEQNFQRGKFEGKVETVMEILSLKGSIPDNAETIIKQYINEDNASGIVKKAIQAESVEAFFNMLYSI